jgi:O-antigen/teichoic acid export membrane protein
MHMGNLRRSLVINFMSSSGAAFMQFALSVVLARMLSPSEIGIFSITVVFVNIAHIFRDFGVASYVQREAELTTEKLRSVIGVMFTSAWLISMFLMLISRPLGDWFGEPGIVPVMRVLAIGFLIIPFGALTNSLLVREFAAEKQAIITGVGTVTFCVSCLAFAALGFGTMSLAWANLCNVVACALASIPFRPKGAPYLPSFRGWAKVAHFGAGTLATSCADAINNALPDLLLGKLGSARLVGLLSRANSTVSIFSHIAGSTSTYGAVSYLSQAHHRGESLVPVLQRATSILTGVGWPAFALTALFGKDIVLALYGPNWIECVDAITPLALAAAVAMMFHYTPTALMAIGRPYLGAAPVIVTLLARIGFAWYLFDGTLRTFAWAILFATLAAAPVTLTQQRTHLAYSIRACLRALRASAVVTLVCLGVGAAFQAVLPATTGSGIRLATIFVPMAAVWYLALRVTGHALLDEVHHLAGGMKARLMRLTVQR